MNDEPNDPQIVTVTVSCSTEGCGNAGAIISVTTVEHSKVVCGPCGTVMIEDVPEVNE